MIKFNIYLKYKLYTINIKYSLSTTSINNNFLIFSRIIHNIINVKEI
jgi:hypothetical protein